MNIAILGAGAWGTALAISLSDRHRVTLWARDAAQIEAMSVGRRNQRYLPEIPLPPKLQLTAAMEVALADAELILVCVPVAGLRGTLQKIAQLPTPGPVIWVCKGFEANSAQLPHQIAAEILPGQLSRGVLSGPSFAEEVARGLPTAMTLASADGEFAQRTAQALHHSRLRIYSSTDVIGVEIGGAVKNVLAIAAGIADGMSLGHNARAALITRGLAEMTRLGLKLGGHAETLYGLSGAGDLILTCTGDLSRNRQVGILLGQGQPLEEILRESRTRGGRRIHRARSAPPGATTGRGYADLRRGVSGAVRKIPAADAVEELLNRAPNSRIQPP